MTNSFPPPRSLPNAPADPDKVTANAAMRYLGWLLVFLALAPPVAVILWRIATMPWG